jgi:hypothetical protein
MIGKPLCIRAGWCLQDDAVANVYSTAVQEEATKTGAVTPCLPTISAEETDASNLTVITLYLM